MNTPYRSLTPGGLDNVWVAGRCIGVDREMQVSIRVMPCCCITRQAAGVAAAMAVEGGVSSRGVSSRGIDVADLQRRLKDAGGFLPNF
jgi:hypothetical protein